MTDKLSRIQKLVKFFSSPSKFEKIKKDSALYRFLCSCGREFNIWEIGGVKYKGTTGSITGAKCPHCGKFEMRKLYKVAE